MKPYARPTPRPGRKAKTHWLTARATWAMVDTFNKAAAGLGISHGELLRRAVTHYLEHLERGENG